MGLMNFLRATGKYSIHGGLDSMVGGLLHPTMGLFTGFGRGVMGMKLNLTNASLLTKATSSIGFGIGKVANYGLARPLIKVGMGMAKNTPADLINWTSKAGKFGRLFFKKAGANAEYTVFGHEARAWVPHAIAGGAIGVGVLSSAKNEDFNLGMRTAVNGMWDTQGVEVTPGSVNPSYTPVYQRGAGRRINNYNADGNLPLALHRQRTSGYL